MNPLRALCDVLAGRPPAPYVHPLDDVADWGFVRMPGVAPAVSEHERLMRHTGRPECPIPEHADALRLLGRMTMERDEAIRQRDDLTAAAWGAAQTMAQLLTERNESRATSDMWMHRALRAEAKLRHPVTGHPDAA